MNFKLFFGLAAGIVAFTFFLLAANTAHSQTSMPHTSAVYFSPDIFRPFGCKYYAEWPEFVCFRGVIIPRADPRKVALPRPDPRKNTANQ